MKITFLVPTLEAGKDGVADYTLELAQECQRQGHDVAAIGFHDAFAQEPLLVNEPFQILRLPQSIPWVQRLEQIRKFRSSGVKSDFVSLQFVPYSFHPKGLVMGWERGLSDAIGGTPSHVMFHELWLGTALSSPWKHRLLGPIQRHFILRLLRRLKPAVVSTSNQIYAQILRRSGVPAGVLPLFGNIPVQPRDDSFAPIQSIPNRAECWLIGFFGAIHPGWDPEPLFSELEAMGRPIVFVQIGRMSPGQEMWTDWETRYGNRFQFLRVGEQSRETISQWLQHLDFGVTTSPVSLVEKSGTVAAMREHGLPVIVTRTAKLFAFEEEPSSGDGLIVFGKRFREQLLGVSRKNPAAGLSRIAKQFIRTLESAR